MRFMRLFPAMVILFFASLLASQEIKAPEKVTVKPGRVAQVVIESSEPSVDFDLIGEGIDVFREYPPPSAKANSLYLRIFVPSDVKVGSQFWIYAVNAKNSKVGRGKTLIQVEGIAPKPPTPDPEPDPGPKDDLATVIFPGVHGLHVLIVVDREKAIPAAQHNAMFAFDVRQYLNTKCASAPDGKTAAWRIWHTADNGYADSKLFGDALKRANEKKTALPWLLISNGKIAWEGPFPGNASDALSLLRKYGG